MIAVLIVVAAAAAAFFYPAYQAMLALPFTMDSNEAHIMSAYLLVIGLAFAWLTRPRRKTKAADSKPE